MVKTVFSSLKDFTAECKSSIEGKTTVFTNGCFDIIHPGHIDILFQAASLGDILIVGLNSDASVRRLKGPGRPVQDETARAAVLAALKPVDYVVIFNEDTPLELIKGLKPGILVKGSEYSEDEIVGSGIAGRTVRINMLPGYSTSNIINKISGLK